MIGITGISNDMRDIEDLYEKSNQICTLALKCFAYKVKKYIGSYFAALNGAHCIVFTGGIGERSPILRGMILSEMEAFGIELNKEANEINGQELSTGKTPVYIIPTDEEMQIAILTEEILKKSS
jgi:acetate kinase